MLEHVSHLRSLHNQLKEMDANIDDKELAMTLLASLFEQLKTLITTLDAVGDENISYEKVKSMLLNDFDRTNNSKSVEDVFLQKEIGIEEKNKTNRTTTREIKYQFESNCHDCLEKGHCTRDCLKPKTNTAKS